MWKLLLLLLVSTNINAALVLTYLQSAEDEADLTTYTFASQNLGTASSDRYIIVGASGRDFGTTAKSITSVTVGGVSATEIHQAQGTATGTTVSGLYIAAVPTGTTGDVVVTFSEVFIKSNIALWAATGLDSAYDFASSTTSVSNALTTDVDVLAGGSAVSLSTSDSNALTMSWAGITKDGDMNTAGLFFSISWASDDFASSQVVSSTITYSGAPGAVSLVSASFSPSASARRIFKVD